MFRLLEVAQTKDFFFFFFGCYSSNHFHFPIMKIIEIVLSNTLLELCLNHIETSPGFRIVLHD